MKEGVVIQDAREEGIEEGFELGIEKGIEQGIEQGIDQGISRRDQEKISDMLRREKTVEEIVDFCDCPYDLVKKIEADLLIEA